MSKPHGGKLINRLVKKESSDVAEIPKLEINTDLSEDVLNISNGVFSPLEGFLYDNDLESVVKEKRLADDTPWTIPILLDFDKQDIKDLKEGDAVLLTNKENGVLAQLDIDEIYTYDIRLIPSAHAEGKLLFPLDKQKKCLDALEENDQIVFRYVDPDGNYAGYPWNPNGSISNIAGICNSQGNVFGMMPHPERTFYRHQHPNWTGTGLNGDYGDGRAIFESVLEYICKKI